MIDGDTLREFVSYNTESGLFHWKKDAAIGARAGTAIKGTLRGGYLRIGIKGRVYSAHRLAILYVTNKWPDGCVDHIDGNRTNNSFLNLRVVTSSINSQNLRSAKGKTKSGILGVSHHASTGKWRSRICVAGISISLGLHNTKESAYEAYLDAKRTLHEGCSI